VTRLRGLIGALRARHARVGAATLDERGITGLETAIILIAFVVVAAVFAFVVLSTGLFSSERGKEAVYAGLSKTRGTMELTGGVIAESNTTAITTVTFNVTLAAGGDSVNLRATDPINRTVISYIDANVVVPDLAYTTATLTGTNDGLLQQGELMSITIDFTTSSPAVTVGTNQTFVIEVKPPSGSYLVIQRTTPPAIDQPIINLY